MGTRRTAVDRMNSIVEGAGIARDLDDVFGPVDWQNIREGVDLEWATAELREAEAATRRLRIRLEALLGGRDLPMCEYCGAEIAGRKGVRFCSPSHRVMHSRMDKRTAG